MLRRERRLALLPHLWETVVLYGTVVMVTQRGRRRILVKGVMLEDGTWVSDHLWVRYDAPEDISKRKVRIIGRVGKYLPYGEIHESYGIYEEKVEVL